MSGLTVDFKKLLIVAGVGVLILSLTIISSSMGWLVSEDQEVEPVPFLTATIDNIINDDVINFTSYRGQAFRFDTVEIKESKYLHFTPEQYQYQLRTIDKTISNATIQFTTIHQTDFSLRFYINARHVSTGVERTVCLIRANRAGVNLNNAVYIKDNAAVGTEKQWLINYAGNQLIIAINGTIVFTGQTMNELTIESGLSVIGLDGTGLLGDINVYKDVSINNLI